MQNNYDSGAPMNGTPNLVTPPDGVMAREPEITVGVITALVTAIIGILVASGVPVSDQLREALLASISPIFILVSVVIIRMKVYSPRSAQKQMNIAAATGNAEITPPPAKDSPALIIANGLLVETE